MSKNLPPKKTLSLGCARAAVWENVGKDNKKMYSVSFSKSYKDNEGNWKNTNYFNVWDLQDLCGLVMGMVNKQIKEFKSEPAVIVEQSPSNGPDTDDIPF